MKDFLDVAPFKQKAILTFFKLKLDFTWSQIANLLGVNRSMIFFYLSGVSKMPFAHITKLCSSTGVSLEKFSTLPRTQIACCESNTFLVPDVNSEKFAEFIGILLGDGCIYSNKQSVCIAGDKLLDRDYFENHLNKLIFDLFSVRQHNYFCKKNRGMHCVINSKSLVNFLCPNFFVAGNKIKAGAQIPSYFFSNKLLLKSCLKGLFDTDGSVCPHPNSKVMLIITIKNPALMKSALTAFDELNFPAKQSKGDIYFYGAKKVKAFFDIINSSNPKHLIKWNIFLKTGILPRTKELEKIVITSRQSVPSNSC